MPDGHKPPGYGCVGDAFDNTDPESLSNCREKM